MVYTNGYAIQAAFKPGDEIYACAFKLQNGKTDAINFSEPTLGVFCCTDRERKEPDARAMKYRIAYFVPYGKKNRLSWSKAVQIESRMFATTEAESRALFNYRVKEMARWFQLRAAQTEQQVLPADRPGLPAKQPGQEFLSAEDFAVFMTYVLPHLEFRPYDDYKRNALVCRMPNDKMCEIKNARLVRTADPVIVTGGTDNRPADGYVLFDVPDGVFKASYDAVREFPGFTVWDFNANTEN